MNQKRNKLQVSLSKINPKGTSAAARHQARFRFKPFRIELGILNYKYNRNYFFSVLNQKTAKLRERIIFRFQKVQPSFDTKNGKTIRVYEKNSHFMLDN